MEVPWEGGNGRNKTAWEWTRESNRLLKSVAMTCGRRKGFPINHFNEMSHLPKGLRSSKGLLLKNSILAWPYPSAFPSRPISPGAGLPSRSPSL